MLELLLFDDEFCFQYEDLHFMGGDFTVLILKT